MVSPAEAYRTWVIDHRVDAATFERIGDARRIADARQESVGVLIVGACSEPEGLIAAGADCVKIVGSDLDDDRGSAGVPSGCAAFGGPRSRVANAEAVITPFAPRVILASGDPDGREWAARLAVRRGWRLISPALRAVFDRDGRLVVTALSTCGRYSRDEVLDSDATAVLTFRPGVAEALACDRDRARSVEHIRSVACGEEAVRIAREIPANPSDVDIRYADRIVAGGRGLGGADGFELLARIAEQLGAGIAASRVAVDLGWIDRERQVGQTGKTVAPALYLACGISGASHHLAGIAEARHIVAINTDPNAPIFKAAHLGVVGDLHEVLAQLEVQLAAATRSAA